MAVSVFLNSAIVLEADPTQRLYFQVFPDPITDTKGVNWANVPIVGRSEPIKTYAGSSARRFSLALSFVASVDAGDTGTAERVKRQVEFLQSLAYPQTLRGGIIMFPPVCILIVGQLINSRIVLKDVEAKYTGPWQIGNRRTVVERSDSGANTRLEVVEGDSFVDLPLMAQVGIVVEEVNVIPDDHLYVRRGRKL